MTRDEALRRAWETPITQSSIASLMLSVERETEARVAEECAQIADSLIDREPDDLDVAEEISDAIRRKYAKERGEPQQSIEVRG